MHSFQFKGYYDCRATAEIIPELLIELTDLQFQLQVSSNFCEYVVFSNAEVEAISNDTGFAELDI